MKLVFLHTSDIHGNIMPTDYQNKNDYSAAFGLSLVSSLIEKERQKYGPDNVIVTDAGDFLQGSPLAAYVHEANNSSVLKKFAAFYNEIGYDARCLGNHDFNFGQDYLKSYLEYSQSPFLNSNMLSRKTGRSAFGQSYVILHKNGLKIGLIGITTQRIPFWEPADHITGLQFESAFTQVQKIAKFLRPQVDVLGVLYHGGFESDLKTGKRTEPKTGENEGYRILQNIPEIDVMLTGHQHRKLKLISNNTAIVQPGYKGECVAKVVMDIADKSNKIQHMSVELLDSKNHVPDNKIINLGSSLDKKTQLWLDQPIAHLEKPALIMNAEQARINGSDFINLIQNMQLYFTKADISATALMSETAQGFNEDVTMRDILLNYPFANQLCKVRLTGKELRNIVEYSLKFLTKDQTGKVVFKPKYKNLLFNFDVFYPLIYEADISKSQGSRLTKLELNGLPIVEEKIYHLAVNNYRAMGGGFYPEYSPNKIETILDKDYVEMFQEYLQKKNIKLDSTRNYYFK